ncbi:hypothetical protein C7U61_18530 [Rhizobium sp. JAB6]|nr:hypothetical protein C7U61_18530 [Rhizobium sp. JAB6]
MDERYLHFRDAIVVCLEEDFGSSQLFVLKDPRICRLVPLFKDASDQLDIELRYIIPYRNSSEVAASLNARDGITADYVKLMWARHVLDAEAETRGLARVFVPYDALLSDFEGVSNRIGACLDVEWPISVPAARMNIAAFLRPDLRHHQACGESLQSEGEITGFTDQILANVVKLDRNPRDEEAIEDLSSLKDELDNNPRMLFVDATFREFVARQRSDAERFRLQLEQMQRDADLRSDHLNAAQKVADANLEQIQRQMATVQEIADAKEEQLWATAAKLEQVQRQMATVQEIADSKEEQLRATAAKLEQIQRQMATVQEIADAKEEQLRATVAKLEQIQRQMATVQEIADAKEEQLRRHQNQWQSDLADAEARVQTLERSLNETFSSYSWRATRPLRRLASLLGKAAPGGGPRSGAK